MRSAVFFLSIDGEDVTSAFDPHLLSLSITDSAGGKSDTLEAELDDVEGCIALPRTGAKVSAGLGWSDSGTMVSFEGVTDEPRSEGSRGGGMKLSITAKSADLRGSAKSTQEKHHGKGDFATVAKSFGQAAGLTVSVAGDLGALERDYWVMARESFLQWGTRMAREMGATFKVLGSRAVFVPRGKGMSASGKPLQTIYAKLPGNVIHWSMSPNVAPHQFEKFQRRWYDLKEAKYKTEEVELKSEGVTAGLIGRHDRPAAGHAKAQAGSDMTESKRDKGGGSITIDGEPAALSQAPCEVLGLREGIDGSYRIETVKSHLVRGQGFLTELTLKQPSGAAGQDKRASKIGDKSAAAKAGSGYDPTTGANAPRGNT